MAISTSFRVYEQVDPNIKTIDWANTCITVLRRDWRCIVNQAMSNQNKRYLDSRQDMTRVQALFKDNSDFRKNNEILPLGILENLLNVLTEEILKLPPQAELFATDPAAVNAKKKDLLLLRNRGLIEADINANRQAVGVPPYKVPYEKFEGNVEEFDKMGLDANESDDVNFYSSEYQRLRYETAGQSLINNIMKINRFDEDTIMMFVRDVLANKVICMQSYVNQITGAIQYRYLYPETCFGVFDDSNDGKNDICRGWQDAITVREWMEQVGNDFNWEKDWKQILWAINYQNNTKYTGFIRNNIAYDCWGNQQQMQEGGLVGVEQSNVVEWTNAYTYKVYAGYIEWLTVDATQTYLRRNNDPTYASEIPYNYNIADRHEVTEYYKESYYQQQWYRSNFLATSSVSQWLYNYGKVYYQQLEGANDEYSSGTCMFYRKQGRSAVDIAKPYIWMANDAFYKMLWAIQEAKPHSETYVYEELIELSKNMQAQATGGDATPGSFQQTLTSVKDLVKFFKENLVRIRSYPRLDGKINPNLPQVNDKEQNGLDPIAIAMQAVSTWAEQQIALKWGMNDLRLGQNQDEREGYKLNMAEMKASLNSTGYIYRMIQFMKERIATTTLLYAQDIIKFKDTVPYKWIRQLVGEEDFQNLGALDNFAAHRMGLFIRDVNTLMQKQSILQAANVALDKQELTYNQWFVITTTEDPKKAIKTIDFLKMKADRKKRKQELELLQLNQQNAMQIKQAEGQNINLAGQLEIQKEKIRAEASIQVAIITTQGRVDVKNITVDSDLPKQEHKAEAQSQLEEKKSDLKQQETLAQ